MTARVSQPHSASVGGFTRRKFLASSLGGAAALAVAGRRGYAADGKPVLAAGQGSADITPPLGIEMAGFHRPVGQERRIKGIRQPTAVRALALRYQDQQVVLVSLDVLSVTREFSARVQQAIAQKTGIPATQVRLCATHSHSTPTFSKLRQWGAVSAEYEKTVEKRVLEAVQQAQQDLTPAELFAGQAEAVGGNFNRTTSTWKSGREFTKESTEDVRWVDTLLQVLRFERGAAKPALLWYHFSSHPVCYTDDQAGPDWPGLVSAKSLAQDKLVPSLLQGHCGDVNPGDGNPWLGDPERTSQAVFTALRAANGAAQRVPVDGLRTVVGQFAAPLDLARFQDELATYRREPDKCTSGNWVDAGFAQDWAAWAGGWNPQQTTLATPLSSLRLGDVGLLFHSGELYSYYGLKIRHESPLRQTLVIGFADDEIGYVPDPNAYKAGEYAAIVVPKILSLPPFVPQVGRELAAASQRLLKQLV